MGGMGGVGGVGGVGSEGGVRSVGGMGVMGTVGGVGGVGGVGVVGAVGPVGAVQAVGAVGCVRVCVGADLAGLDSMLVANQQMPFLKVVDCIIPAALLWAARLGRELGGARATHQKIVDAL